MEKLVHQHICCHKLAKLFKNIGGSLRGNPLCECGQIYVEVYISGTWTLFPFLDSSVCVQAPVQLDMTSCLRANQEFQLSPLQIIISGAFPSPPLQPSSISLLNLLLLVVCRNIFSTLTGLSYSSTLIFLHSYSIISLFKYFFISTEFNSLYLIPVQSFQCLESNLHSIQHGFIITNSAIFAIQNKGTGVLLLFVSFSLSIIYKSNKLCLLVPTLIAFVLF